MKLGKLLLLCLLIVFSLQGLAFAVDPHFPNYAIGFEEPLRYPDVKETDWYYEAVEYVSELGLVDGINGLFEPGEEMTRAAFVTALGRLSMVDTSMFVVSGFSDVPAGEWYAPYVMWASQNGIVGGYGDGKFGPDDSITREQMCAILIRYSDLMGIELANGAEVKFVDAQDVSLWAVSAVERASVAGLINGVGDGKFLPQGTASRAHVSTIIMNFNEQYGRENGDKD